MSPVLVDSNVIIDVATIDPIWSIWSEPDLRRLADETALVINPLIYAEVGVRYGTPRSWRRSCRAICFDATRCLTMRRSSLAKRFECTEGVAACAPPHAAVRGYRLLTRDPRRYRGYFPTVELIAPERRRRGGTIGEVQRGRRWRCRNI